MKTVKLFLFTSLVLFGLIGCATQEQPDIRYDPAALRFDGEQAFATETEFVTQFPNRDSGQPNNKLAAEWLHAQFSNLGLTCAMQEWEVINYSKPLPLNNVVCSLPGASEQEIVIVAHLDQSAGTTQGAVMMGILSGSVGSLFLSGWRHVLPVPLHSVWIAWHMDQLRRTLVVCAITSGAKTHPSQVTDSLILI